MLQQGIEIAMPECDASHVIGYLFEIGPTLGEIPLTHAELAAWQANSGIELNSWEARMLRQLSVEYLSEYVKSRAPEHPSPLQSKEVITLVGKSMKDSIRELANL